MATGTLQFEKQAVETAEQELKQAEQDFTAQLKNYTTTADGLLSQLSAYLTRRRFWLE